MNQKNLEQVVKLNADLEWCHNIFDHMEDILKHVEENKIDKVTLDTLRWLVKQGKKFRREE
jgi:hypothetical protein